VEPDLRDEVVAFIRRWSEKTGLAIDRFLRWLNLSVGKYYEWCRRTGEAIRHNGKVPRDFWLQEWEKQAILDFQGTVPCGRLSAADVHDDGRRRGGRQPVERVPGPARRGAVAEVVAAAGQKRHGVRAAFEAS